MWLLDWQQGQLANMGGVFSLAPTPHGGEKTEEVSNIWGSQCPQENTRSKKDGWSCVLGSTNEIDN